MCFRTRAFHVELGKIVCLKCQAEEWTIPRAPESIDVLDMV